MMSRLRARLGRFKKDEAGTSTVEFVLVFPLFIALLMGGYEIGLLMTRQVMLERGMDIAVRDLRLGRMVDPTHAKLKTAICNAASILPDCESTMLLELTPVSTATWTMPSVTANCVDRTGTLDPVISFNSGLENELMLVRACFVVDPIFPGTGLGAKLPVDSSGGYRMVVTSSFVNEPNT